MKKYYRVISFILIALSIGLLGYAFGFFNYSRIGHNNKVIAGSLYLTMNQGVDSISIQNALPETKEEARSKTGNTLTFTLKGKNTSTSKNIYYEVFLNNGADSDDPNKIRINAKDLVFDLIEIGPNDTETYVLDAVSYDTLANTRIWIDSVDANTTSEIERTYKLRVWISDNMIVSDSLENKDYTTEQFSNLYASVRVGVEGDLEERILPLFVVSDDSFIENDVSYVNNTIQNIDSENSQDTFSLAVTSSNSNVEIEYNNDAVTSNVASTFEEIKPSFLFDYDKGVSPTLLTASTSISHSFTIQNNKKVTFKIYLTSVNGKADSTDLHYTLQKNGVVVQTLIKHVNVNGEQIVVPVVEFVDKNATYNGSPVPMTGVTVTNSDNSAYSGTVTYTYYHGTSCTGQALSSAPVNAGSYSVKIFAPSGSAAPDGEACAKITIGPASLTCPNSSSPSYVYSGQQINSGITCPTGSSADGQTSGFNVGSYSQTCEPDSNHTFATTCTATWSITPLTCSTPTNISVNSSGQITWTASSNCSTADHQVKVANGSYETATSGVNKLSDITAVAGSRTISVKALAPNANYNDSSAGSGSTTVHTVTLTAGTGISAVSGAGRYITGATVTLGATVSSGYKWSKWNVTSNSTTFSTTQAYSGTISGDWTLTAVGAQITYTKREYNCAVGNYAAGSFTYVINCNAVSKSYADNNNLGQYVTCTSVYGNLCSSGSQTQCYKKQPYNRRSCAEWKTSPASTTTGQTSCTPSTTAYKQITCTPE